MKKFLLTTLSLIFTLFATAGCMNPSMEDGFDSLSKSLSELEAAIAALNIPQMQEDLESMNATAAQMLEDVEAMQGTWDEAMVQFSTLQSMLDDMVEDSANWATTEDMQSLLIDIQTFGEGVDLLVLTADYDHDGVINALDKCPDTPIMQINEVNSIGCATGEKPLTD